MKRLRVSRKDWGKAQVCLDTEYGARWRRWIGRAMRAVRLAKQIPVLEVCAATGLNRPTIQRIEQGRMNYNIDSLILYCRALKLKPGALLDEAESHLGSGSGA